MEAIESIVAYVENYQRARDLLRVEEMVLAVMVPNEPETRPHVISQIKRVEALRAVDEYLKAKTIKQGAPA